MLGGDGARHFGTARVVHGRPGSVVDGGRRSLSDVNGIARKRHADGGRD